MNDKGSVWMGLLWAALFCLFAVAGGLGTGYMADPGRRGPRELKPVKLAAEYSFDGPVKVSHLELTRKELIRLNRCARQACTEFKGIDVHLSPAEGQDFAKPETLMKFEISLETNGGEIVRSMRRDVRRKYLVRSLERTVGVGLHELERVRKLHRTFTVLYI